MQGFVKIIFEDGRGESKYFVIDDEHTQLRIGSTRDEAQGQDALVLQLSEISEVNRVDSTTLTVASSAMPPGTKPLMFKPMTTSLTDSWYAHLSNQPAGLTSSQESRTTTTAIHLVKNSGGESAPSSTYSKVLPVLRFVGVILVLVVASRFFWKWLSPAKEAYILRQDLPRTTSPGMGVLGYLGLVFVNFGLIVGMLSTLLASKLNRERGKLTFRFQEERIGIKLKTDATRGIIVDSVEDDCETVRSGVRIKDAKVMKIAGQRVDSTGMTSEDAMKMIEENKERPLVVIFQSIDRSEIDQISETFSRRVAWAGFGWSLVCLLLFRTSIFPPDIMVTPQVSEPKYRPPPIRQTVVNSGFPILVTLLITAVIGGVGAIALYLWVRTYGISAKANDKDAKPSSARPATTTTATTTKSTPTSPSNVASVIRSFNTPASTSRVTSTPASASRVTSTPAASALSRPYSIANPMSGGVLKPVQKEAKVVTRPVSTPSSSYTTPVSRPVSTTATTKSPPVAVVSKPAGTNGVVTTSTPSVTSTPVALTPSVNRMPSSAAAAAPSSAASSVVATPPPASHLQLNVDSPSVVSMNTPIPPELERFANMRMQGLSETAVKIAMSKAFVEPPPGFLESLRAIAPSPSPTRAASPTTRAASPTTTASPPAVARSSSPNTAAGTTMMVTNTEYPSLDPKYQKMLDMGLSKMTVGIAMRKDGIEPPF